MFLDTETTGLPIKNDFSKINITEIGWVITDKKLNVIHDKSFLIKGDYIIPEEVEDPDGPTANGSI